MGGKKTTHLPCNSCGKFLQVAPTLALRFCTHPKVVLCGTGTAPSQQAAQGVPIGKDGPICRCTQEAPCRSTCTCANSFMSGGCDRCNTYQPTKESP